MKPFFYSFSLFSWFYFLYLHEEENYYTPVWNNNSVEYESNSDRNKTLSLEECLNKIRKSVKDITNDLVKSDT